MGVGRNSYYCVSNSSSQNQNIQDLYTLKQQFSISSEVYQVIDRKPNRLLHPENSEKSCNGLLKRLEGCNLIIRPSKMNYKYNFRLQVVPHFPYEGQQSDQNASARENHPTRERRDAAVRENPHFSLFPPRLAFLAWRDFQVHSSFARSTIPEGR